MQQKERVQCTFDNQIKGKDWIVNCSEKIRLESLDWTFFSLVVRDA
jgi:hypothetical protein